MKVSELDYDLPEALVAQHPARERDAARLLAHDLAADRTEHAVVADLPRFLDAGDLLVVNDTRVIPARLFGRRRSGGRVEVLLLEPLDAERRRWSALVNPARKLHPDEVVELEGGALAARMIARPLEADGRPRAGWEIELVGPSGTSLDQVDVLLERVGHVPLPPYIRRERGDPDARDDRERYQTVYAERPGAVAAPTAGLHFTPELLARLDAHGVRRARVTLHVGHGTFRPIECERVEEHPMHAERFELPEATAEAIAATRARGGRVVAVGTTSVRVLESCAREGGGVRARSGSTDLFLFPGSPFRVVDALLTNFHLPRSSLLALVAAFAGRERILRLYREAVERGYRFFSYGDAMLLSGRARD